MTTINIKIDSDQLEGTEASFSTWLVKVGDKVTQGQPIAELETDKVAMEICAAGSGVIKSLSAKEGDKIEPEQSLGLILSGAIENKISQQKISEDSAGKIEKKITLINDSAASERERVSPAVRRLLHENNLSIDNVQGSGKGGRVTRDDVVKSLSKIKITSEKTISQSKNIPEKSTAPIETLPQKSVAKKLNSKMIPHTTMRKSIASHMVNSLLETSPHVTSVFEMDMDNIIQHRKWHKKEYAELGVKLTFTAYFLAAMAKAVKVVPQVNAKFHEDALEIFSDVNIGVGTALGDKGLVVPVVHQVQSMDLFQIAKSLNQQTEKARTGKLTPSDMKQGTLTISNHGVSGSLFATPIIINQPQVAILGIGKLEKRVVVEQKNGEDVMVIRPKCYVSLSIDHRALDAHQTNLYLSEFVKVIEGWGE